MTLAEDPPARVPITPSVLREARTRARLGPEWAAEIVNKLLEREGESAISVEDIESWERGIQQPSVVQAEALAQAYFLPFIILFQEQLPPANVTDFRRGPEGRLAPMSYATLEKLDLFSRLYAAAKRVWSGLGLSEEDVRIPSIDIRDVSGSEDIEVLASEVRASLGVSDDHQLSWKNDEEAFWDWRWRFEAARVSVFILPMNVEECRGASIWEVGGPPAVLVNSADETTAQLFTLAHEYAHLMFARYRGAVNVCDPSRRAANREERAANRFAAAVLMPRGLVLSRIPYPIPSPDYAEWPQRDRRRLRNALKVSSAAIGIRLKELGLVADAGPRSFWRQPREFIPAGVRRPAWQRYRGYTGRNTLSLVKEAVDSKAVSATELARILGLKVRDVEEMLG